MEYLLVELRFELLRVEDGIEGVGVVGAHKAIIFDCTQRPCNRCADV